MSAAPGWYDDGEHHGRLRYWDGTAWTGHFVERGSGSESAERSDAAGSPRVVEFDPDHRPLHASPRRRVVWPWLVPLLVLGASGATFLALWLTDGLSWVPGPLG